MTAQKHLRDLLSEDQEPFVLENYIADYRRCHFSRRNQATTTSLTVKKLKLTSSQRSNSFVGSNLCRSVCFSFQESPDSRQSAVPGFAPPCKTVSLLLEVASRIPEKTDSAPVKRSLFGSILKSLTQRKRRKPEIDIDRRQKPTGVGGKPSSIGCTGHSRRSSAWWSESNGERSLGDLEESTSGSDAADERVSTVSDGREDWEFDLMDGQLCKSPVSFSLRKSPTSSDHISPDSSPPVASSPVRRGKEEIQVEYGVDSPKKLVGSAEPQLEKEQCSPVSILDPAPFEDDRDDEHEDIDGRDRDYNSSYANVQRTKHQLLEKLYRFEKLAELDPIELERRMLEQDSDFEEDEVTNQETTVEDFTKEVLKLRFNHTRKIPLDLRNLVSDLISEEWGKHDGSEDRDSLMKRVCGKLWKEVDSDTIDMMVEEDFKRSEMGGWKKVGEEQVGEIVLQIEVSIFVSLVMEFFQM